MNLISLRPLEEIDPEVLEELRRRLAETFTCPVEIKPQTVDLACAYKLSRNQYHSTTFLSTVTMPEKGGKPLGIADVDLYVPELNFAFGEADRSLGVAIISLFRLSPERYDLPPNRESFIERAAKEASHELGHAYGLGHCHEAQCIMYFSNSLMETDREEAPFYTECHQFLENQSIC